MTRAEERQFEIVCDILSQELSDNYDFADEIEEATLCQDFYKAGLDYDTLRKIGFSERILEMADVPTVLEARLQKRSKNKEIKNKPFWECDYFDNGKCFSKDVMGLCFCKNECEFKKTEKRG